MHISRDSDIRQFLKRLVDYFRKSENHYVDMEQKDIAPFGWAGRPYHARHAILTHRDDMTKFDLPCFIQTASSDITRWRYDVNAHVDVISGRTIVFSHEKGGSQKNASWLIELILLDHIIRCRGEGIKIVVSDNASVGKTWLTTIVLPQYLVGQGLAEIALIVFLENNHGNWLADLLFGQLQTRRRRCTVLDRCPLEGIRVDQTEVRSSAGFFN